MNKINILRVVQNACFAGAAAALVLGALVEPSHARFAAVVYKACGDAKDTTVGSAPCYDLNSIGCTVGGNRNTGLCGGGINGTTCTCIAQLEE